MNPAGGGSRNPFGADYEKIGIKAGDKYTPELGATDSLMIRNSPAATIRETLSPSLRNKQQKFGLALAGAPFKLFTVLPSGQPLKTFYTLFRSND
jgi:hypothetical protein